MSAWLLRSPWWLLSIVYGTCFALMGVVVNLVFSGGSLPASLGGPVVGGLVFGALMGPVTLRESRRVDAVVGPLQDGARRAAERAARRGPVPADPQVRAAAVRVVDHQLAQAQRRRGIAGAVGSGFVVLYAVLALTGSAFWWMAAALFALLLVQTLRAPSRLRRRRALLGHPLQGSGERSGER